MELWGYDSIVEITTDIPVLLEVLISTRRKVSHLHMDTAVFSRMALVSGCEVYKDEFKINMYF